MKNILLLLLCSMPMLAFLLSACGTSNNVGGYLYTDSTSAVFLTLTNKDGNLTGTCYATYMNTPAHDNLKTANVGVNGSQNDTHITLTASFLGLPVQTYTATLNNNQLTMVTPQSNGMLQTDVFNQASIDDYNNAVAHLQSVVAKNQHDEAVQQHVAAIAAMQAQLHTDMSALAKDSNYDDALNRYKSDIADMQTSYHAVQQDGCTQSVYNDNQGVINGNEGVIMDDNNFSSIEYTVQSDIKAVQDDAKALGQPTPDISTYQQALTSAQAKVKAYDAQAKQLVDQSQALVDKCGP